MMQYRFNARITDNDDISDTIRGITANFAKQTASLTLVETVDVRVVPWVLRAIKQPFRIVWDMMDNQTTVLGRTFLTDCQIVDHSIEQAYHTSEVTIHTIEVRYAEARYAMVIPS